MDNNLSIINNENTKQIRSRLQHAANSEFADELAITTANENTDELNIAIQNDKTKPLVSAIITDEIIKSHEQPLIQNIINKYEFSETEKSKIFKNSLRHIPQNSKRRNIINHHLLSYLTNNDKIILDGFINFRLQEYKKELELIVQKGLDDFFIEKEYQEFINLLRYFVEIQAPKEETIHVVALKDKHHEIYNAEKRNITQECRSDFIKKESPSSLQEQSLEFINYDDLLVSTLITLAPNKLYFHGLDNLENKELALTIQNVFLKRLTVCHGCSFCQSLQ